jgi:hypothetical protein
MKNAIDNKKETFVPQMDTIKMTRAEVANVQQLAWNENIELKVIAKKGGSMVTAPVVFLSKLGFYPF